MKLYHGTSLRHLKSISDKGLVPRGARPSNWKAASHDGSVYLSNAYALYFADQAQLDDEGLLLVEVETDRLAVRRDPLRQHQAQFARRTRKLFPRSDLAKTPRIAAAFEFSKRHTINGRTRK
jgi:hypothetical protein